MEGHCSTGQTPQWAVVPMEEEEEEEEEGEEEEEEELSTTGFYNRGGKCLLRGTTCVFK